VDGYRVELLHLEVFEAEELQPREDSFHSGLHAFEGLVALDSTALTPWVSRRVEFNIVEVEGSRSECFRVVGSITISMLWVSLLDVV